MGSRDFASSRSGSVIDPRISAVGCDFVPSSALAFATLNCETHGPRSLHLSPRRVLKQLSSLIFGFLMLHPLFISLPQIVLAADLHQVALPLFEPSDHHPIALSVSRLRMWKGKKLFPAVHDRFEQPWDPKQASMAIKKGLRAQTLTRFVVARANRGGSRVNKHTSDETPNCVRNVGMSSRWEAFTSCLPEHGVQVRNPGSRQLLNNGWSNVPQPDGRGLAPIS